MKMRLPIPWSHLLRGGVLGESVNNTARTFTLLYSNNGHAWLAADPPDSIAPISKGALDAASKDWRD
jgi:hypothetical protein